jgi:hypothetical protein
MLRIGFTKVYYTLWDVSDPYKHYYGQDAMDWEWRTDYQYMQNLSKDFDKAVRKANDFGCADTQADTDLYGRNSSFYVSGEKGTDRPPPPPWEYPEGIHRDGHGDIREFGMRPVRLSDKSHGIFVAVEDRLASEQNDRDIKALWTLYLKKSIWSNEVNEHHYKVLRSEWVRPVVYARRQLANLGVIVKYNGEWTSANHVEKLKKRVAVQAIKDNAIQGYHEEDKKRITVKVKEIDYHSFEGQWGTTHLITMIDENNRLFNYMGSKALNEVNADEFTSIKATIKHNEYKGVKQTKLQRILVVL